MAEEFWARPILFVRDVEASIAYYCEKLGFTKRWDHGGDMLIIAGVGRSGVDVILDCGSVLRRPATPAVLTVSLRNVEALGDLYSELKERGAKIVAPPFAVVWQKDTYEIDVEDLDGNVLVFWGSRPANEALSP